MTVTVPNAENRAKNVGSRTMHRAKINRIYKGTELLIPQNVSLKNLSLNQVPMVMDPTHGQTDHIL